MACRPPFVPLVGFTACPIVVAPGEIMDMPVVDQGRVIAGKVMRLSATFDHRLIDGAHAAVLAQTLRAALEDPERHLGATESESLCRNERVRHPPAKKPQADGACNHEANGESGTAEGREARRVLAGILGKIDEQATCKSAAAPSDLSN